MLFALDLISNLFSVLVPTETVTEQEESLFHFYLYFLLSCWKKDSQVRINMGFALFLGCFCARAKRGGTKFKRVGGA